MTCGWSPDLSDLSLELSLSIPSYRHVTAFIFCFISSLFLLVCLMSHDSTVFILPSRWIDRHPESKTNPRPACLPPSEWLIAPAPRAPSFLPVPLRSRTLARSSLPSRGVNLSTTQLRRARDRASSTVFTGGSEDDPGSWLSVLYTFGFLSLTSCQIVISSSRSRRDVLSATLLKGCIVWRTENWITVLSRSLNAKIFLNAMYCICQCCLPYYTALKWSCAAL